MLVTLVGIAACDEKLRDLAGPSPALTPTFSSIRDEILRTTDLAGRTSCVTCHRPQGGTPMSLLDDPYAALVNASSRQKPGATLVVPGDPDASYLIQKLEGRSDIVQLRMPRNGPPYLTPGQITVIRRWIELGAPNN
jgi:hypothetical protein